MADTGLDVVTGAFGYSGQYITKLLLAKGRKVRTLTNSPFRMHHFGPRVEARRFHFNQPEVLAQSLTGATTLYNTYWVRFNHKDFHHADAVDNTLRLFEAAKAAGVERVVHVSITRPSEDSPFEYFRGKALLEKALVRSGLSHAILRPTVIFGPEDILINNIAWVLRRFPVFGVFGDGRYRLQPIHVEDFAHLAVENGARRDNVVIDAIGPETFTFRELVHDLGEIIGKPRRIIGVPPGFGQLVGELVGRLMGDVTITKDEIGGLMADLLYTESPPAGATRLTDWARANAASLGVRYHSELARRQNRTATYGVL